MLVPPTVLFNRRRAREAPAQEEGGDLPVTQQQPRGAGFLPPTSLSPLTGLPGFNTGLLQKCFRKNVTKQIGFCVRRAEICVHKKSANLPDSLTPRILPLRHTLFMKSLQGPMEGRAPELSSFQGRAPAMIIFFQSRNLAGRMGRERENTLLIQEQFHSPFS